MSQSDEELQSSIEKGAPVNGSPDALAYQKIFEALKQEPYHLPANFADSIIGRVEARQTGLSKDYLWFGLGLFTLIVAGVFAAFLSGFKINFGAFKFISGYSGLFLFALVFVLLVHFLDKQLIGNKIRSGTT